MLEQNSVHDPGKDDGLPRFGRKSQKAILTVNPKYGRLYFSAYAVKALSLAKSPFRIEKIAGGWVFAISSSKDDLTLKVHQGAYYVVAKKLVQELLLDFEDRPVHLLIEGVERKRKTYHIVRCDLLSVLTRKKKIKVIRKDVITKDPLVTEALRLVTGYHATDFHGRVKTIETLRAEHILSTTKISLV